MFSPRLGGIILILTTSPFDNVARRLNVVDVRAIRGDDLSADITVDLFLFLVKVCGLRTFATEEDPEAREVCLVIIFSDFIFLILYSPLKVKY